MALQTDIPIIGNDPVGGQKPSKADLRTFGRTMAGAFAFITLIVFWRSDWVQTPWVEGLGLTAALFLAFSIVWPKALQPIEWAWMKLAVALNFIMTRVLLSLVFFLAVTPIGLIFRLLRKDLLGKRFDATKETYWTSPEEDGTWTRPEKPY